jgi:hypothetical protein
MSTVLLEQSIGTNVASDLRRINNQVARSVKKNVMVRICGCGGLRRDGISARITGCALVPFNGAPDDCKFTLKMKDVKGKSHKWTGNTDDIEVTQLDDCVLLAANGQRPLIVYI